MLWGLGIVVLVLLHGSITALDFKEMIINQFRAGIATTQNSLIPNVYNLLKFVTNFSDYVGVVPYDTESEWNNLTFSWKPQAGKILWTAQCWLISGIANQ